MNAFKKSALILALAAAAAGAQAGPVEIYGVADIGYSHTKVDGSTVNSLSSSGKSDSFIGIKAGEDLGSGMKAVVTLESGYDLDTGTTSTSLKRETSLGITYGEHTLKAGRLQSLGYAAVKQFDVFGGGNLGMARGASNVAEYNSNTAGYTLTHGDFQLGVQHSFGEQVNGNLSDASTDAFSIGYAHGPVGVSVVRTEVDSGAKTTQVAGGYDFGIAKASVIVQDASNSALDNTYMVGVSAPVKGFVASASIGQAKMVSGEKIDLYSVGGGYNLSKRTSLYAAYGRVEYLASKGEQLSLGMNHSF